MHLQRGQSVRSRCHPPTHSWAWWAPRSWPHLAQSCFSSSGVSRAGRGKSRRIYARDRACAVADLCFDFLELPARGHVLHCSAGSTIARALPQCARPCSQSSPDGEPSPAVPLARVPAAYPDSVFLLFLLDWLERGMSKLRGISEGGCSESRRPRHSFVALPGGMISSVLPTTRE